MHLEDNEEAESIRLNSEYWFDQTHCYFRNIIGRLIVEKNPVEGALFERSVMQCFNAIAMNAEGEVVGSNWGSFPGNPPDLDEGYVLCISSLQPVGT